MTLYRWSQTAATNATADSTISYRENQAPSTLNDSARAAMAAVAKARDDWSGVLVTGGSSTAYTLSTYQVFNSLYSGLTVTCRMHATNGTSPTLAVDGLGAKAIHAVAGTAVVSAEMAAGSIQSFTFSSTHDAWVMHRTSALNQLARTSGNILVANGSVWVPQNGATALSAIGAQAVDTDLTAVAALSSTGVAARTGDGTWATRTITTPNSGLTTTNGDGVSGNPSIVPADDLAGLEGLSGVGLPARTGVSTWSLRSITAPNNGISVSNGDGVSGSPAIVPADDLAGLEGLSGVGVPVRTGISTWTLRTISATAPASISNGDGVSGAPVISVDVASAAQMEGATSLVTVVTPGRQHSHPGHPKAWCKANGASAAISASYNITSTTDNTTGDISFTVATAFSSVNYSAQGHVLFSTGSTRVAVGIAQGVSVYRMYCVNGTNDRNDPDQYYYAAFGDQ